MDSQTPSAKRYAVASDDEVSLLQEQIHALRKQLDEQTSQAEEEAKTAALKLLREQHRCQEVEAHREFLAKSEERLKSQLSEARQAFEKEHAQRLEEKRGAAERCEQLRDELLHAAATERDESQRKIGSLQRELQQALASSSSSSAAGADGQAASGSGGGEAAAAAAAARREAAELRIENETLQAKLAAAERKLSSGVSFEEDLAAAQAEAAHLREELSQQRQQQLVGASGAGGVGAGAADGAALASDLSELRRQLAAADELRAGHERTVAKCAAIESQVQSWCVLFSRELGAAGEGGSSSEYGLPPPNAAQSVKNSLDALRREVKSQIGEIGELQTSQRAAKLEAATATKAAESARAERDAAKAALAGAEEAGKRSEWAAEELKVKLDAREEHIQILKRDREAWRDPQARKKGKAAGEEAVDGAAAGGGGGGGEAADASSEEAALLRTQLKASEARCAQLTAQTETLSQRAAEAANAVREAKLEAAAAKEQTATATAISRQASLAVSAASPSASTKTAAAAAAVVVDDEAQPEVPPGTKVLHMSANPASNAQQALIDGLRSRVRALRMQLEMSDASGGAAGGGGGGGGGGEAKVAAAAKLLEAQAEVEDLRKQVSDLGTQKERLKTVFQEKIKEFRDTVMKLIGFRVDMPDYNQNHYDLYPPFVPATKATVLTFRCHNSSARKGEMELLATELTERLTPLMEAYLGGERPSFPAFLAAVALALYDEAQPKGQAAPGT